MKRRSPILSAVLIILWLSGGPLNGHDLSQGSETEVGGPGAGQGRDSNAIPLAGDLAESEV
jgi:hypothetical protein